MPVWLAILGLFVYEFTRRSHEVAPLELDSHESTGGKTFKSSILELYSHGLVERVLELAKGVLGLAISGLNGFELEISGPQGEEFTILGPNVYGFLCLG